MSAQDLPVTDFTLDGQPVQALHGETVWDVARRVGVDIPHLCHTPGLRPAGNCRACVVEVAGERVLAASCCRAPQNGMAVSTRSERALRAQRTVLELLQADAPDTPTLKRDSELAHWAQRLAVQPGRWPARGAVQTEADHNGPDQSHPAMAVNLNACIQCTRCVRACRETQGNDVLGLAFRGGHAQIVFDQGDPMGLSTCVACGECVQACPTGAIAPANGAYTRQADRTVDSVCPYCGVGCQLTYHLKDGRIDHVEGAPGPANDGRLCVKGRFGFDYVQHPDRLTRPLIRRADAPKDPALLTAGPDGRASAAALRAQFREASWDEALAAAADGLRRARDAAPAAQGRDAAVAGFGSAKGTNEEAYLFQKLIRSAFHTHNVDHCTRLCHASSVAALMEGIGSGAVSNPVRDVEHADFVFIIGANPAQNHPVGATWIKNAVKRGARLVIADPRHTELSRHAWRHLAFKPGTDVALLNAMLHTIVTEGLVDEAFIAERTLDYPAFKAHLLGLIDHSAEAMAPLCGIDAQTLREVARAYATSRASIVFWGMGVSQHTHGTDNARCLIALAMLTGQIGRSGTGLHPLRGQNNVQGASDAGLIPMVLPDYQRVGDSAHRERFERAWGLASGSLPEQPGLTVVEILHAARAGRIRAMLIQGENPAMSDPDSAHAREALARLDHLVVQDIFLTETAALADVVLPATAWPEKTGTVTNTDRTVQIGRKALAAPGEARADAWITEQLAQRLGLPWAYGIAPDGTAPLDATHGVGRVFDEMAGLMPAIAGLSWARLWALGSITHPVSSAADPGQPIVFTDHFPTPTGRARLVPATYTGPVERPDADYPLVLITGRQLEHWHTGAMTRRSAVLDALEPAPSASLHPDTIARLGLRAGGWAEVASRRGALRLSVRADEAMPLDVVFIPFAYVEAAANLLTNPALDPVAKIAELKHCAVRVGAVA